MADSKLPKEEKARLREAVRHKRAMAESFTLMNPDSHDPLQQRLLAQCGADYPSVIVELTRVALLANRPELQAMVRQAQQCLSEETEAGAAE